MGRVRDYHIFRCITHYFLVLRRHGSIHGWRQKMQEDILLHVYGWICTAVYTVYIILLYFTDRHSFTWELAWIATAHIPPLSQFNCQVMYHWRRDILLPQAMVNLLIIYLQMFLCDHDDKIKNSLVLHIATNTYYKMKRHTIGLYLYIPYMQKIFVQIECKIVYKLSFFFVISNIV